MERTPHCIFYVEMWELLLIFVCVLHHMGQIGELFLPAVSRGQEEKTLDSGPSICKHVVWECSRCTCGRSAKVPTVGPQTGCHLKMQILSALGVSDSTGLEQDLRTFIYSAPQVIFR